jgi:hypothetical protein
LIKAFRQLHPIQFYKPKESLILASSNVLNLKKHTMKKLLAIVLVICCYVAEAQIQTPAPSPGSTVTAVVGLTEVKVNYSRPKLKGRKIFGAGADYLQPYGQIWRTGANNGTFVSFSDAVKINGTDIKKGEYLVFTIPAESDWTVMFYSDLEAGALNNDNYDKTKEVARWTVKGTKLTEKVETLTINISDIADNNSGAKLEFAWENTSVKLPFTVDYDAKVMSAIETGTKVSPGNYITAARYYFDNGKDLNKALEWITLGIENGDKGAFWNIHTKAKIQSALGDKKGALVTAQKSLDLAVAYKDGDFGYKKLNEDLIKSLNEEIAKAPKKK